MYKKTRKEIQLTLGWVQIKEKSESIPRNLIVLSQMTLLGGRADPQNKWSDRQRMRPSVHTTQTLALSVSHRDTQASATILVLRE